MKKQDVCVKLTHKNCKKVLGILEMFGEKPSPGLKEIFENPKCIRSQEHIDFNLHTKTFYRYGFHPENKTLIKPKELKQILAKEHLKADDVIVIKTKNFHEKIGVFIDWVICNKAGIKTSEHGGYYGDFVRYATDKEKALLEPKLQISEVDPVETKCGIIEGFTRYTREVWVNHYSNGEFDVYENKDIASFTSAITRKTVKATLTYDIPMTKV